jgi:iron complex outermembrane receptor protein
MALTCPGVAQQNAPATGTYRFSIPAEPLGDALSDLAQQTGLQVMISSKLVEGIRSRELNGTFSADEALQQLLANTGLQFMFVNQRTVAINTAAGAAPNSSQRSGSTSTSIGAATPGPGAVTGPSKRSDTEHNSTDGREKMQNRGVVARWLGLFALCGSAAHTGTACAQETGTAGSPTLEEVVVTSQKRSERLLDVPMSVSAISGEQLSGAGIGSTRDLQQVTPGLVTVSNGFAFTPAIRGVSSIGTSPGDETNVSMYLDDVYLGAPMGGLFQLKDIERVEVLKGPQGTLFGRNATGGAIRIVTKAPSFDPHAELSTDYGFDYETLNVGGAVTGGLSDTVAASLTGAYSTDDGYAKGIGPKAQGNRYAKDRLASVRGKLLFKPSDELQATVAADYSDRNSNQIYAWASRTGRNGNGAVPSAVIPGPFQYSGSTTPKADMTTQGASLDVNWTPSDVFTLRSITAYRDAKGLFQTDSDRISVSLGALRLEQNQHNLSQEFNFSGPADRSLSWIAGLYYYHSNAGNPYFSAYTNDAPGGVVGSSFSDTVKTDAYAGYGELTWNATDTLHFIAGGRYTGETKQFRFDDLIRAAGIRTEDTQETWRSPTFRGVARYDLADDANVYLSVSSGFKSGVFNAYALPATPVKPEKILAYELGAKARAAGITFAAAAFAYDYKDIQVQGQTFFNGSFVVTLANAARAKIRGFEVSANGAVTDTIAFNLGVSAMPKADYEDFTKAQVFISNATGGATSTVPYNASGSRVIRSPKVQADAGLIYNDRIANGESLLSINYSYTSNFYWQPGNITPEGAYGILNARVAWTEPSGHYTFSAWGNNLTDETYSFYTTVSNAGTVDSLARPREFGVGVEAKF